LVLYGVALLVLSVYGGTGAGHSPRLGRQVFSDIIDIWRGRKRGQCPAFAAPYTVQPTLLTLCAVTFDRSTPNLPESGHTAMPWCPPEQHTTAEVCMRRAGKSRPVDAVQLQQTFASPQPPVYSSRSDYISGDRTCTARNQRLLCSNLPAHRRLHDRSRCQIAERC
jgi:hypothetical protein